MKKLLPLIVVLVFASVTFAQRPIAEMPVSPLSVDVNYDKFKDITFLVGSNLPLSATGKYNIIFPDVTFQAGGIFKGEKATNDTRYFLNFRFVSRDWVFLRSGSTDLVILADSSRMNLTGTRTGDVLTGRSPVKVSERLMYHVTQQQMEMIAKAKSVELQIGAGFEATLSLDVHHQLRSILAAVDLKR